MNSLFFCQIYVHIPGSEKLILELPLVIGTAGLGSRSNSVSSQEGSVSNASQSWVSLRMPSQPPSYCDVTRDCSLDQPLTPLLDDFDGDDSPIFMNAPAFPFPPSPPAYTEVGVSAGVFQQLNTLSICQEFTFADSPCNNECLLFPGGRGVQRQRSHAASVLKSTRNSRTGVQLSGTGNLKHLKRSRRSKIQRRCVGWSNKARTVEVDRKPLACSVSCLHRASSPMLILKSSSCGALQVVDTEAKPQIQWHATFPNKLSLPEGLSVYFMTLLLGPSIVIQPQVCCDICASFGGGIIVIPVIPCCF